MQRCGNYLSDRNGPIWRTAGSIWRTVHVVSPVSEETSGPSSTPKGATKGIPEASGRTGV